MNREQILSLNISDLGQKVREVSKLPLFMPARDNASTWSLVENLREAGLQVTINTASESSMAVMNGDANIGDWHVNIGEETVEGREHHRAYATTMPEAVCRAYLLFHFGL
ncbi:hypothetical protein ACYEXS_19565 [Paenibacillus sp. MAH-36]|uniref:Uncharacterized protein n=1 Tax=Paenibacillus violae TaxID=3077234 RepID=A0ABU3R794_9BACL|nr:hypothetical protein [Paenibacillus sp. PFR10]MDU0200143.1 hypothetical protein [Paenibacillus sp. PFR10]